MLVEHCGATFGGTFRWNKLVDQLVEHVGVTYWWRGAWELLPIVREAGVRRDTSQHGQLL